MFVTRRFLFSSICLGVGTVLHGAVLCVPRVHAVDAVCSGGDDLDGVPISAPTVAGLVRPCSSSAVLPAATALARGYGILVRNPRTAVVCLRTLGKKTEYRRF